MTDHHMPCVSLGPRHPCCALLQDEGVAARVQALLSTPRFRCYRTTDVTGVELGGALKNVLAIACGEWGGWDRALHAYGSVAVP